MGVRGLPSAVSSDTPAEHKCYGTPGSTFRYKVVHELCRYVRTNYGL